MHYKYKTQGVCAQVIEYDIVDNKLQNVVFYGGCDGNLKAIGRLVEGMDASAVAKTLEGNICGMKKTSCADQLSKAVMASLEGKLAATN